MKHLNLYATVGRGERKCIATIDGKMGDSNANALADQFQAAHLMEKLREGVAPERVQYERENVGGAPAKKGKQ